MSFPALPTVRLVFSVMNLRVLGTGGICWDPVNKEGRKHILIREDTPRRKNSRKENCARKKAGNVPGPLGATGQGAATPL